MQVLLGVCFLLLQGTWEQYRENFKTALVFSLLLIFVPLFALFPNIFLSSGTIFLDYNLLNADLLALAAEAVLIALFLLFYSFFLSIILFSVRKNLSKVKLQFYMHEMMQKFALRIFAFFVLYCLLLFLLASALISFGVPLLIVGLILFLVSFALLFVPQAVVVEEEGLKHAILTNFEFLFKKPRAFLTVAVVGAVFLALLQILEFAIAQFTLFAPYISLLISLVFILPFVEIMKTYLYMMRFDLIKHHEIARKSKPHVPVPEPGSLAAAKYA